MEQHACSWIEWFNIIKMSILQIQCNSYWNPNDFFCFCRNSINNPKIHLEPWRSPINGKDAKNTQWTKGSLFIKWYWDNWISIHKRMKLIPFLTLYTKKKKKKSTQNGLKNQMLRHETEKLFEENITFVLATTFFWMWHQKHSEQKQK